jgi:membrane protease subunit (stomatin/prohibitin family)
MIYQMVGFAVKSIELNEQLQNMFNNHLEYYLRE